MSEQMGKVPKDAKIEPSAYPKQETRTNYYVDKEKIDFETKYLQRSRKEKLAELAYDAIECKILKNVNLDVIKYEANRIGRKLFKIGGTYAEGHPYYEAMEALHKVKEHITDVDQAKSAMERVAKILEKT